MPVNPPRPKPPPLSALRAFEAAARLGGFARAADELCVTPGAISQQIKALEEWAGAPLFMRHAQGISLTPVADRVLPLVGKAFDALGQSAQILQSHARNRLNIATLPALAQLWLSPKLPEIRRAFPDVELSVTALESPPNLLRDPYGLSIFYGSGQDGEVIEKDEIFPVCAPAMAGCLQRVTDLGDVPCLSDTSWPEDWNLWLKNVGVSEELNLAGPSFSLYSLAVAEAVNGAGVLMGHKALVQRQLDTGELVRPFDHVCQLSRCLVAKIPPHQSAGLAADVVKMLIS